MSGADIKHIGLNHKRTEDKYLYREKILADKWEEANKYPSQVSPVLACILHADRITQREAEVAATVIQWLGSNVGNCFLHEYLREVEKGKTDE